MLPAQGIDLIHRAMRHLALSEYDKLLSTPFCSQLTAEELQQELDECEPVAYNRESIEASIDAIQVARRDVRQWSVVVPVFSRSGVRTDYSLEMTITNVRDTWTAEIDNVHIR